MKLSEVKKFSDGTLVKIHENLIDMMSKNKLGSDNKRLNGRDWTDNDVKSLKETLKKIDKILKHREQVRNLEEYVGGRPKTVNLRAFTKDLHQVDYTQLYDFFKMNQEEYLHQVFRSKYPHLFTNTTLEDNSNQPSGLAHMATKGAKKEWGLSPKAKVRVLHTTQLDVTIMRRIEIVETGMETGTKMGMEMEMTMGMEAMIQKTVRHEVAYEMTWKSLMKMMIEAYCSRSEIKKMVPKESDKVEKYTGGLPDNIQGNVMSARPKMLQEAIELANSLIDQKVRAYAARQANNKTRMDNSPKENHVQQPPYKRNGEARRRVYALGGGEADQEPNIIDDINS
nr:hypothetical protein [Tanacetum cinerariifolium]